MKYFVFAMMLIFHSFIQSADQAIMNVQVFASKDAEMSFYQWHTSGDRLKVPSLRNNMWRQLVYDYKLPEHEKLLAVSTVQDKTIVVCTSGQDQDNQVVVRSIDKFNKVIKKDYEICLNEYKPFLALLGVEVVNESVGGEEDPQVVEQNRQKILNLARTRQQEGESARQKLQVVYPILNDLPTQDNGYQKQILLVVAGATAGSLATLAATKKCTIL